MPKKKGRRGRGGRKLNTNSPNPSNPASDNKEPLSLSPTPNPVFFSTASDDPKSPKSADKSGQPNQPNRPSQPPEAPLPEVPTSTPSQTEDRRTGFKDSASSTTSEDIRAMEKKLTESQGALDQMETVEEIENTDTDPPFRPRPENIQYGEAYDNPGLDIPEGGERLTHRFSNLVDFDEDDDGEEEGGENIPAGHDPEDDDYVDVGTDLPHTHHTAAGHAPLPAQQPQQPAGPTTKEEYAAKGYDTGLFAIPADPKGPYSKGQTRPQVFSGPGPALARKAFKEKKEEHERKVRARRRDVVPDEIDPMELNDIPEVQGVTPPITGNLVSPLDDPSWDSPGRETKCDSSETINSKEWEEDMGKEPEKTGDKSNPPLDLKFAPPKSVKGPYGSGVTVPVMGLDSPTPRTPILDRLDDLAARVGEEVEKPEAEKDKEKEPEKTDDKPNPPLDPMFVPATGVKGPYGTGVTVPVMGLDSPPPRTPIIDRLGAWADRVGGEEEKPEDLPPEPKIDKGKGKEKVPPEPSPDKGPYSPPSFIPSTSVQGPYGKDTRVPVMGGGLREPTRNTGKGPEKVAEKPKPKPLNPMFENYPPRNDGAFVDGAIPGKILKAPVMGRDDATVGPRSPRLPFNLGPPIRSQPKRDEPKKDEPKEAPKATGKETTAPPTAPKESTQEEPKPTATTKKAPGIFRPPQTPGPATEDGKIVRGPVMGVDDEKEIRTKTLIPVKNAREQVEKGDGKKRPESILDAAKPVTTPEIEKWKDYTRKNPDKECTTLGEQALLSLHNAQDNLTSEIFKYRAAAELFQKEFLAADKRNRKYQELQRQLKDEYERRLEEQKKKYEEKLKKSYSTDGLGKCKQEKKQLTARVEELEEKEERLNEKLKKWRIMFDQMGEQINPMQRKLMEVGKEDKILEDRFEGADREVELLEKQIGDLRKERGLLPDEVVEGKYKRQIAALRQNIEKLDGRLIEYGEIRKQRDNFHDRLLKRDREATELENQLDNFKRDIRLNPDTVTKSQCEREKARLQQQIDPLKKEKAKLQEQIDELEPLRIDIGKMVDESNEQKVELRAQKRNISALEQELWNQKTEDDARIDELKAELEAARQDTLAAPETQASRKCEREKAQLRQQIHELANTWKDRNQGVKEKLEEQYSLIDSLEAHIKDLEETPERGGTGPDPNNQAATKCEREKVILQGRIDELKKEVDKAKEEPDWDVGPDPDFDLPSYTPFSLRDLESEIKTFGRSTPLTHKLAITRCKEGIHNCRVSRALRGYANGDVRVALVASREALKIAKDIDDPTSIARSHYWYGYALWYCLEMQEAWDAFEEGKKVPGASDEVKQDLQHWIDHFSDQNAKTNGKYKGPTKERAPYVKKLLTEFWQKDGDD